MHKINGYETASFVSMRTRTYTRTRAHTHSPAVCSVSPLPFKWHFVIHVFGTYFSCIRVIKCALYYTWSAGVTWTLAGRRAKYWCHYNTGTFVMGSRILFVGLENRDSIYFLPLWDQDSIFSWVQFSRECFARCWKRASEPVRPHTNSRSVKLCSWYLRLWIAYCLQTAVLYVYVSKHIRQQFEDSWSTNIHRNNIWRPRSKSLVRVLCSPALTDNKEKLIQVGSRVVRFNYLCRNP